ncbi:class 1b ribonucleoside-diphosphate reductase subunit alpha [Staphylococcus felis]|uniref:class 1b ribonucleoside-diphosphate reductase subunit alpha n=1 Tax=Staphylococcus felis TaxID=46127 RepID=UPI000E223B35|nr:class 1b ribonucleoside-diphosphate reductase subunit alpha [Staphylococcus felis]REI09511.1 ribonucleotide-diphosphate reductase subunit alpha [Staphylococcus felis]
MSKPKSHIELNNEVMEYDENGNPTIHVEKDAEAVKAYFIDHVNVNMRWFHNLKEKVDYLVDNDYWDSELISQYTFDEIKTVFKRAYSFKFRFPSYMSAFKFYNNYAMKSNDKKSYLERYEDRVSIVALFFGNGDFESALRFVELMMSQKYQPATPTFLNAGKARRGAFISCFLLECGDSLNDINQMNSTARQLSKIGGGVSINLTKTRAKGESLKGYEGVTSGVVPIMKNLDQSFRHINQMGQRQGSASTYLNVFHADIYDFLATKKISADDDVRTPTLNIGVVIPDKMIELARNNEPMYLFYPKNFYDVIGEHLDEVNLTERYDEFITNPELRLKKIDPRGLLERIAITQIESGYPYIMFYDNVNNENQLSNISNIKFSNLCSEILQPSIVSKFGDYGDDNDKIGLDISCNLGSINIANTMESGDIENTVSLSIDALNRVSNTSDVKNAPGVKKANDLMRSVGLGAMNLHGYLANNSISYESKEAIEFVDHFFSSVRFYALKRSMETAKKTGLTFMDFENSGYSDGTFFDDYVENKLPRKFTSEKVSALFNGIKLPTKSDWRQLQKDVEKYGLYNSLTLAIAPTGSISYVQSATASVMPIMEKLEVRTYGNSKTFYPMPNLDNRNWFFYKEAYSMDMMKVIDLIATIQKHVDQGISFTVFVTDAVTTRDLTRIQLYAHYKGIKTLYYVRQKDTSNEECVSCAV